MSIYKDCDIRGIYGEELFDCDAYKIGRAASTLSRGADFLVAGDLRLSTPALKAELIRGLTDSGSSVIDAGTLPTPVFYFAKRRLGIYGGITVTASHNPAKYNGFKLCFGEMPITPSDIAEIKRLCNNGEFSKGTGRVSRAEGLFEEYKAALTGLVPGSGLRVVLDCGGGASCLNTPDIFRSAGYDVCELFCTPDGSFPFRDPNPAVYSHLTGLQGRVLRESADFGIAFDGDGDRAVFVDEKGNVVQSEKALVLMIKKYGAEKPFSVVYDIKSSSIVRDAVTEMGGEPIPERSGHAFIKRTFLQRGSALAGEISGHFFFRELGGDDGTYAGLVMGDIIARSGKSLSELVSDIRTYIITPDIRVPVPYSEQDGVLARVRTLGERYDMSLTDGVRIETPDGWLLVRKSVTEQAVTVRMEARDEDGLAALRALLAQTAPELAEPLQRK